MKFDANTGEFSGVIQVDTNVKEGSVVYVHAEDENVETSWYPNGYDFEIKWMDHEAPAQDVDVKQGDNRISFICTDEHYLGHLLTFKVTPKKQMDDLIQ